MSTSNQSSNKSDSNLSLEKDISKENFDCTSKELNNNFFNFPLKKWRGMYLIW